MKTGQDTLGRWVAKLASKAGLGKKQERSEELRVVTPDQLKQVGGGTGNSTSGPNKGW